MNKYSFKIFATHWVDLQHSYLTCLFLKDENSKKYRCYLICSEKCQNVAKILQSSDPWLRIFRSLFTFISFQREVTGRGCFAREAIKTCRGWPWIYLVHFLCFLSNFFIDGEELSGFFQDLCSYLF